MRGLRGVFATIAVLALSLTVVPAAGAVKYKAEGAIPLQSFYVPVGISVDGNTHDVYVGTVASTSAGVRRLHLDLSEPASPEWVETGLGSGQWPGVAVHQSTGKVYAKRTPTQEIVTYDSSGNLLPGSFLGGNSQLKQIATDAAGNIYDLGADRVTKFTSAGVELQTIECSQCLDGRFGSPAAVAIDSNGNIYVADRGGSFNERQLLEVTAGEGTYALSFEGESTGAEGTGDLTEGSIIVENVDTASGAFVSGATISGTGIPAGTKIVATPEAGKLELSAPASETASEISLTSDLPFDAGEATIQEALSMLPTIGSGNVQVEGSGPYTVTFTGSLGGTGVPELVADSSGLSGGEAKIMTLEAGATVEPVVLKFGPGGDAGPAPTVIDTGEALSVAVNTGNDDVFVLSDDGDGSHVTAYDESGTEFDDFGLGEIVNGLQFDQLGVDPSNGTVYVGDLTSPEPGGNTIRIFAPVAEPAATTGVAGAIGQTTATLNGTVDPNGVSTIDCHFEYTTQASFDANGFTGATQVACDPDPEASEDAVAVSADVTGLTANTAYRFRVVEQTEGGTAEGSDGAFSTLVAKPVTTTEAASGVGQTGATLNGKVDAEGNNATCTFEYGTSNAYGKSAPCSVSPVTGTTATAVSAVLSGLSAATTYHYRVVASNVGGETKGADMTFTTAADTCATNAALCPPPTPPATPATPAAPATPASPAPKPLKCKKGFKKKTVKGKQKCVKVKKKKKKR